MKRLFKWLIILFVLLLVLLAAVTYGALHYAKSDKFKQDIIAQVKQKTGRDLSIDGDLNLSVYPWAGVNLQQVTLSNAQGFGDKPFLKADSLALRIKTMPLLKQQYELDTLRLHGLELNLAKNKDGVSNWDDLASGASEDQHRDKQPSSFAAVILGGVDIKDGKIRWRDASTGQQVVISDINANTGELSFGDPIELVASLKAVANQPAIKSDVKLKGTLQYDLDNELYTAKPFNVAALLQGKNIPGGKTQLNFDTGLVVDLDKETANIEDLTLTALGTELKAQLLASEVKSDQPKVDGKLQLQGKDIARLFKVFEIEPLASELAKQQDKSFSITTSVNVDFDEDKLSIPDLSLKLLDADIAAAVTASNLQNESPSAAGELQAKGTNLPLLLKLFGQFQGGQDSTLSKLANDVARTKHKSFDIQTKFSSDMSKGTVDVPSLSAKLLGANIQGQVAAGNLNSDSTTIKGQLKANGPDLPSLLQLLGNLQKDGQGTVEFGQRLAQSANKEFDIDTTFDLAPGSGRMDVSKLNAEALGLKVNGNLQSDKKGMDGRFTVKGDQIRGLLTALDQADLAAVLKAVNVDVGIKGRNDDMQLSPLNLQATLSGKQIPNSPVNLTMTADTRANLKQQTASIKNLSLKGLGLDLTGNINVTELDKAANFNGNLAVAPFNLRAFLQQLNQPVPKTADKKVLQKFSLASDVSGSKNSLALNKLTMLLDDSELRGDLSIQDFAKPAIKFGLGVNQINVDRYLPPQTKTKATPETAAAGAAQLPIETLRGLNINGDLLIGDFVYSNIKMKDVKLSLQAKDGLLQFNPAKAQLYEGSYLGNVSLNATGNKPKLTMKTQFQDIQVEPLLTDMTGDAAITGKGNVSLNLTSTGADVNTLRNTLGGTGELALEDGIFKGVDIPRILKDIEIKIENKDVLGLKNIPQGGETPFDSVTGTLQIKSGVVRNEDLALLAPGFEVAGKGMVMNLADQTWKYDLEVEAVEERIEQEEQSYHVGGHRIPIRCRGKLADKNCKPDAGKIVSAVAAKQVDRELGKFLDKLSGKEEEAPASEESAPVQEGEQGVAKEEAAPSEAQKTKPAPEEKKDPIDELKDKALEELFNF